MTGASPAVSFKRKPTPRCPAPYPSFCFSSLLMGAAPAVHTDVADTRQSAAVAATRLHGVRWGTEDPEPRPLPASLMAPRFRARAAATPGRRDTSPDAGGKGAASRAEGGMRSNASGRRRRTTSRSHQACFQRQRCRRPELPGAPPPAFRCRSLGNRLPQCYFRVGPKTSGLETNGDRDGERLAPKTEANTGREKGDVDKRRDWGGAFRSGPPPTRELATRRLPVPACTASCRAVPQYESSWRNLRAGWARCTLGRVVLRESQATGSLLSPALCRQPFLLGSAVYPSCREFHFPEGRQDEADTSSGRSVHLRE